jgi:teichuronic acid biosynthesis glycosyltransferase TuaC
MLTAEAATMPRARQAEPPLRLLTLASLYPNRAMPTFGIFVENRLRRLAASGEVASRVVAPVPWFFSTHPRFGAYARWAAVPRQEERHGLDISHPRYLMVPKLGTMAQPYLLYEALRRHVRGLLRAGARFDLIDAQYYYPDGVAAAWLARDLGLPLVITARGTDLNLVPHLAGPRRLIARAALEASASITVCAALGDVLRELGVPAEKIRVLRNGVDLALFSPGDRAAARRKLDLKRPTLLSVGHLVERKGHHLVIEALAELEGCELLLAGAGPERSRLEALARRLNVEERVRFLGEVPHEDLPEIYQAADVLVLASSREGWANVLLEAMACGTPVVATDIWGTPEVVAAPEAGRLLPERSAATIARTTAELLGAPPDRARTRRYAEAFSWESTVRAQIDLYRRVAGRGGQGEG